MFPSSSSFLAARLTFAALMILATPTYASAEALEGSWRGNGSVSLPSGATEKARCKISFSKQGGKSYGMNAVCASSSARVAQTASLEQVGANRYAGSFNNPEYNVSGTINVTVNGTIK